MISAVKRLLLIACFLPMIVGQRAGWWMTDPLRWVQTNLRETDSATDPAKLVQEAAAFHANVMHVNMGGIVATYPTQVEFHYRSRALPPGRDFFGEVLRDAHRRGIRVVARFDFSKTRKPVYDAHPDWFFQQKDGNPVVYNGLYSTCINSPWYRVQAMKILTEALDRYPVDGVFFNMFGNQSRDYSGRFVGHCHCGYCQKSFRQRYGKPLPADLNDARYREFMFISSREVAAAIGRLIREKRPNAGYFNYIDEWTDGIMSESNTAVDRPLPLWPYASSDNVNRARNSQPEKMAVNLCMQFVDFPWRHATVPAPEIVTRLWQNLAHGGALAFAINGVWDQQDRLAVEAARPVFAWAAQHEDLYAGQTSLARVVLLNRGSRENYRGLFRLLSEAHIPFAVASNTAWVGRRDVDLVVSPSADLNGLEPYIESGGKVLVSGAAPGSPTVKGYLRIRKPEQFPSLRGVSLLMLNGSFARGGADRTAALTLIPESMFGPPEYIHADMQETWIPALTEEREGRLVRLPFELGAMYYRFSLPSHAGLFSDLLGRLLKDRQLESDAHPLVEFSLMRQGARTLLHLVNLSGHSQTAWFPPVPMRMIRISLAGEFPAARALRAGTPLDPQVSGGRTVFQLPELRDYEVIELAVRQ